MKDSLDHERQNFNLSHMDQKNARFEMQRHYKMQLDDLMNQKNKMKEQQRSQHIRDRQQFTTMAIQNQQEQKMKEKAYKNYYELLLKNQEDHQKQFINPYSLRDSLKDSHIQHSVQEGQIKLKQFQLQERQRNQNIKNRYKQDLLSQIQQKRKLQTEQKQQKKKYQEQYRMYGRSPSQLNRYERVKQRQQMKKYKEDLDQLKVSNQNYSRSRSEKQMFNIPDGQHHLLINPLPYNIQNPYILKEMHKQTYKKNSQPIN